VTHEEVVNEFIARIVRVDLDAALELVTPDVEYDNVPLGKVSGPEGIRSILGWMIEGLDEVEFVIVRQIAAGNIVMNERLDRFRIGDQWIDVPVAGVFEVDDNGLITLWRDFFDQPTLMDRLAEVMAHPA